MNKLNFASLKLVVEIKEEIVPVEIHGNFREKYSQLKDRLRNNLAAK